MHNERMAEWHLIADGVTSHKRGVQSERAQTVIGRRRRGYGQGASTQAKAKGGATQDLGAQGPKKSWTPGRNSKHGQEGTERLVPNQALASKPSRDPGERPKSMERTKATRPGKTRPNFAGITPMRAGLPGQPTRRLAGK